MASEEAKKRFISGLKKYHKRGIPIFIEGELAEEKDWDRIFQINEDGSFYMGDYVGADEGELKEIHFDKVYYK